MKGWMLMGLGLILTFFSFTFEPKEADKKSKKNKIRFVFKPNSLKFENPLISAGEKFPELNGITVEVRRKGIGTLMAARPKPDFIFRKKENRKYVIYITDSPEMNADSVYTNMTLNAQTGVLGHELSHILTYSEKNNFKLILFGIKYAFNRRNIESETDQIAMNRGFGTQLIEYTRYVHRSPHINKRYLQKKNRFYLTAKELEQFVPNLL